MESTGYLRIVIADDYTLIAESLAALLAQEWPTAVIDTVIDYASLIEHLKVNPAYDFVVVDLGMPRPGAEPPLDEVRSASLSAVLILVSGSVDALEIGKAMSRGADAFVHKNQGAIDLIQTIGRFASTNRTAPSPAIVWSTDYLTHIKLSRRESQTLQLLAKGLATKEIALSLEIAPATVKIYLKSLFKKTSCHNRTELAVFAIRNGI